MTTKTPPRTYVNAAMRGDPYKPPQMQSTRPGADAHKKVQSLGLLSGKQG